MTKRALTLMAFLFFALVPLEAAPLEATTVIQEQEEEDDEGPLPLEAARSVTVDANRGTWMSLDVSPDGRTIVFDFLGDLYTLPIEGGEATRLTSGMAFDAQPRFGPDGERVVFTSDRSGGQNIWIMSLDGSDTVQVSRGKANRAESPEFTPDGEYVVASMGDFRGGDLPKLHLFHVEGGSGTSLIDGEDTERLKTLGAAFGEGGRYIWFAQRRGDWEYNADLPQYQLAVYDRETGKRYTRSSRYGSAFRPTLSPDGRWLVYGTRHDEHTGLRIRDLTDGSERWLAYPVQHDDQESRATMDVLPGMSFTPDSRHVVASYDGRIWKLPVEEGGRAEEIPFRVQAEVAMGPEVDFDYPVSDSPNFLVRQIRDAVPSPDGSMLAFTAMDHLWVSEADGSNPRRLTTSDVSEHYPTWSPDGGSVAYVTWDTDDGGHVYRVPADGSAEPRRLTGTPAVYLTPAWSPDGERIVALRGWAREFRQSTSPFGIGAADELVWVPAEGGEVRVIGPTDGRESPHFTEGSDRIYLFDDDEGLVSIRWDGTDQKAHLKVTGSTPPGSDEPMDADLIRMAPRGDQALASINRQLFTVTVPRVGGEAPTVSVSDPDRAEFPARKLTDPMGGEFPAWGPDGRTVHWSLGKAHFVYDLARARAVEDSVETARGDEDEEEGDDEEAGYEPEEFEVRIQARRDIPRGTVALRGARIVTMNGDQVFEDGTIVVRNNRIVEVGPTGSVDVPDDARVFSVENKTIVPGFVDTHAHMWPSWGVHRKDQWIYMANLAYGVTTTRDPQTATTDVLSYADMVRAGDIPGPRVYSTGPGVFWQEEIEDLDHARDVLRRYSEYFDTKTLKMYVAGNRRQRQWIIMAARELGLMPTTEGSLNFKQNVTETIDGYPGLEHSLPIYPVYDDVTELFVVSGRTYTPTLLVAYGGPFAENFFFETEDVHGNEKLRRYIPHEQIDAMTRRRESWFMEEEHVFQDHAAWVRDLVEAGGNAGVGSHGQLQGLGYHWELWAMQSADLDEHEALRIATLMGARAIGLDQDLGSLEPGKLADLVVLNGNPLRDIRATNDILYVMKNGRLYQGRTLMEVWPRQQAIEPLWWWNAEPSQTPGIGRR